VGLHPGKIGKHSPSGNEKEWKKRKGDIIKKTLNLKWGGKTYQKKISRRAKAVQGPELMKEGLLRYK